MSLLEGRLRSDATYKSDEPVRMGFELANRGDEDLYVLTWYTPLEGLFSDCLKIWRGGDRVDYDGVLAKRGTPTAENYVLIPAGQAVSSAFELSTAYDVSAPGHYEVTLNTEIREYFSAPSGKTLEEEINEKPNQRATQPLVGSETGFIVVPGEGETRLTMGQAAREWSRISASASEALDKEADFGLEAGLKNPNVTGGDAQKQALVRQAHLNGYNLCLRALADLANDNNYQEWFGAHTAQRYNKVKNNFTMIRGKMESETFTYILNGQDCKANMHAYTHKGLTAIWICPPFWNSPAVGADSKASTLLHEHTHASARTDDLIYDRNGCRQIANDAPDSAVVNASNYEYFAE